MLGIIILVVALIIEVGCMIYSLKTKEMQNSLKHVIRLVSFVLVCVLILSQVIHWSFRWELFFIVLLIQCLVSVVFFVRKSRPNKPYKKKRVIMAFLGRGVLLTAVLIPAILFPQYDPIAVTGCYAVKTESYTLTDKNRIESYSDAGGNRNVTIQFWYPDTDTKNETYPLVVFSHGSFGFRGSNYSAFVDLASNGYVVCSIDHTYNAFFTKQTDGQMVIVNNNFMNDVMAVQNNDYDAGKTYQLTHEWLKLRTDDMNFVLDTIRDNTKRENAGEVYSLMDTNKIGLFGHSIGGATAAELGRERQDIDAVIVIDGTMIGEEVGFENGKALLDRTQYPIPILNIYNEQHYVEASANAEIYGNMVASANAINADQVMFKGAGHLNFTDLPLYSPCLARMLGTGNIDSRYCIETMNRIMCDYFDYYLKNTDKLTLSSEY